MWTLKAAQLVLLLLLFLSACQQAFGRHTGQQSVKRNNMNGAVTRFLGRGGRSENCHTFLCPGDEGTQICCRDCNFVCGQNIYGEKGCIGENWVNLGDCSTRLCPSDGDTPICCPDCDYHCGENIYQEKGCIKNEK